MQHAKRNKICVHSLIEIIYALFRHLIPHRSYSGFFDTCVSVIMLRSYASTTTPSIIMLCNYASIFTLNIITLHNYIT